MISGILKKLPRPEAVVLFRPLRHVPPSWLAQAIALSLGRLFRRPLAEGELDFLEGRRLAIRVDDLALGFQLSLAGRRLCIVPAMGEAEATIAGPVQSFLELAAGRVDPDTLFFQRRLRILGDTELGLALKNFLDAHAQEALPEVLRDGLAWLAGGERQVA